MATESCNAIPQKSTFSYSYKSLLIYGFAIFAMFFGSGNLVYPLQIGLASGTSWAMGLFGLFITGILLPFLGVFVIKLYEGNYDKFFGEAGSLCRIVLPFFSLSLLGSFGIIPRCVTVAHGGLKTLFPDLTLFAFSSIFCTLTFIFCIKNKLIVNIIGKWMTPILLIALTILVFIGILHAPDIIHQEVEYKQAFQHGFFTGYHIMDLLAAFFFSSFVFFQIRQNMPSLNTEKRILKFAKQSSFIGASLLFLVYAGLVFLGAHYSFLIKDTSSELMLPLIAKHIMGNNASILISITIVLTCLTTAIALNNIYAQYIAKILKVEEHKFYFVLILLATTAVSFAVSLLDFNGISNLLNPILKVAYPGIIALTVLCILSKRYKKLKTITFYGLTLFMVYSLIA